MHCEEITLATVAKEEARNRFDPSDPAAHEFLVSVSVRHGSAVGGPTAGASTSYVFADGSEVVRTVASICEICTFREGVRVFKEV